MSSSVSFQKIALFAAALFLFTGCLAYHNRAAQVSYQTVVAPDFNGGTPVDNDRQQVFQVGVGFGDATEYPCEQLHGGYIDAAQKTHGILTREYARAFIIGDKHNHRAVFVLLDDWATSIEMRERVAELCAAKTVVDKFGNKISMLDADGNPLYNRNNIMITPAHSHTAVMGDAQRRQYNISAGGFQKELLEIEARACMNAIAMAHQNIQPATIDFAKAPLVGKYNVTKNRSMGPFLNNSEIQSGALSLGEGNPVISTEEFQEWAKAESIPRVGEDKHVAGKAEAYRNLPVAADKNMYLFRFKSYPEGKDIGLLNWFSIHCTSISASNPMISGDNKAVAQQMTEAVMGTSSCSNPGFSLGRYVGEGGREAQQPGFIAGFAQGALGDVDPRRIVYHQNRLGYSMEEEMINVKYAARSQAAMALKLYHAPQKKVNGTVAAAMNYIAMDRVWVDSKYAYQPETYQPRTFPPASGIGMGAGGEIHQPGIPGCYEGFTTAKPLPAIKGFAHAIFTPLKNIDASAPTLTQGLPQVFAYHKEFQRAHEPKPILMASGMSNPSWMDLVLPFQLIRIGDYAICGCIFETTTMSAYRIKNAVKEAFAALGDPVQEVIYAGNTNGYASYMATPDEYLYQHYEGASTNYGIQQQPACMQEFARLAKKITEGTTGRCLYDPEWVKAAPELVPPELIVIGPDMTRRTDYVLAGKEFGQMVKPFAKKEWKWGETLEAEFYSSNMNARILHNDSFFYIQRFHPALDGWVTVSTDNDYNNHLRWNKKTVNHSTSTVSWRIPEGTPAGDYRIVFNGYFSPDNGSSHFPYSQISDPFSVIEISSQSAVVADRFTPADKGARLLIDRPQNADTLVLRLKEALGNAVTSGTLTVNNETFAFRNLKADGTPIRFYFPDTEVNSVRVSFDVISQKNYQPELDCFLLADDPSLQNEVFEGKFALFCK